MTSFLPENYIQASYILYSTYSEPCLLSQIQTYSGTFTSYSNIFNHMGTDNPVLTLAYLEPCRIQSPGIFRRQDIFKNSVKTYSGTYSGIFRTLCNALILRTTSYSELCDSAANKGWSTVNYRQSFAFCHSYLSCNDHCDW